MAYLVKKNKYKKIIYSGPFLLFLLLIIIFVVRGAWGVYQKDRDTSATLESVTKNLGEIKERKSVLLKRIENLDTEKGMETEIRRRFNVVKEGEKLIVIVDKDEDDDATLRNESGFWNWLKNIFK